VILIRASDISSGIDPAHRPTEPAIHHKTTCSDLAADMLGECIAVD
jgi:hypothetical protein